MMSHALELYAESMRLRHAASRAGDYRPRQALSPLMRIHAAVRDRCGYEFNLPTKERKYVVPRQMSMYLMRRLHPHASYPIIGKFYGGCHHTTVMKAIRSIQSERKMDENLDRLLTEFEEKLKVTAPKEATASTSRRAVNPVLGEPLAQHGRADHREGDRGAQRRRCSANDRSGWTSSGVRRLSRPCAAEVLATPPLAC